MTDNERTRLRLLHDHLAVGLIENAEFSREMHRLLDAPSPTRYRVFVLGDGREIFIDPAAVTVVFDEPGRPSTSVVATGSTNMVVPYTAAGVMEILR